MADNPMADEKGKAVAPATALPWHHYGDSLRVQQQNDYTVALVEDPNDGPYIVRACNAYPKLIAALREMSEMYSHAWDRVGGGLVMMEPSVNRFDDANETAANLLRELGEMP